MSIEHNVTRTFHSVFSYLLSCTQQAINEKDQMIKRLQEELAEAKAKLNVSCLNLIYMFKYVGHCMNY